MFFTIFKLPRTGSTRIAKYLSRAPNTRCINEILNGYEGDEYAAEINRRLDPASLNTTSFDPVSSDQNCLGFSLNPFRHFIDSTAFFDPKPYIGAQGNGLVISLIRENVFQQSVSFWLSTQLKMWPGDNDADMASELQSYIQQGGIEIPPEKLKKICKRFLKQNRTLVTFSKAFADANGLPHLEITYEGVFNPPNADIKRLETKLGITLEPELAIASKKVLPPPEDWLANFDELSDIFPPNNR